MFVFCGCWVRSHPTAPKHLFSFFQTTYKSIFIGPKVPMTVLHLNSSSQARFSQCLYLFALANFSMERIKIRVPVVLYDISLRLSRSFYEQTTLVAFCRDLSPLRVSPPRADLAAPSTSDSFAFMTSFWFLRYHFRRW